MDLSAAGARDHPARHQTLAAAIAWSYDLLSLPARTLFRRLSVFAGGFSLQAAESVGADNVIPASDAPGLLLQLMDASLVVAEADADGMSRYRLLETLREYAAEQLQASGEAESIALRHAAYFVGLAESSEPELFGAGARSRPYWSDSAAIRRICVRPSAGAYPTTPRPACGSRRPCCASGRCGLRSGRDGSGSKRSCHPCQRMRDRPLSGLGGCRPSECSRWRSTISTLQGRL
jgi:hypothetical protein